MSDNSKKQRIIDCITNLPVLENSYGGKHIPDSIIHYQFDGHDNLEGKLLDIEISYIMKVANQMGYKCWQSNFGGIGLIKKGPSGN